MALPSNYSIAHAVTLVASGGHLVRPVDANGVALDDATTVYSVAHPVLETDSLGIVLTDATKTVSNPRKVTIDPKGSPVVTVDSTGVVLGTTLGGGTPTLHVLTLSNYSIVENSSPGTVVANIIGTTAGSALSLSDSAGSRFAISGSQLVIGSTNSDYETATSYNITIVETLAGATGTPKSTTLTITITNAFEQPTLGALAFSSTSFVTGTASSGTITGATAGSTITASGLPTGVTIDSAARTWAYDGTGSASSGSFTLTQTLADSSNSPRSDSITYTVTTGSTVPYDTTIGNGVDSSGFAALPLHSGAKRFFVSSSTGSDANTITQAQSPSTPLATLTQALTFVTPGQGDQILIAEGTTYSVAFPSPRGKYGFSEVYPTVIQSYDPADALNEAKYGRATANRPEFTATGLQEIGSGAGSGLPLRYFAMRGMKFNPASVSGNSFSITGTPNGKNEFILIENNVFANMQVVFDQYDIYTDPLSRNSGWVIRGNAIYGGWASSGHAQGLYMSGTLYTVEDNVIYHGGWKIGANRQDDISVGGLVGDAVFRHNLYIQENSSGIARRNLSIEGAADGGQYRGDVLFTENLHIDNPIGVGLGGGDQYDTHRPTGVSLEGSYNVLLGSVTIDNSTTPGDAWMMSSANGQSGSSWHHNIGAHAQSLNGRVFDTTATYNVPSYMDYTDNVTYQLVSGSATHTVSGGTVWEEGTYVATQVHATYARNAWDDPTSGTNTNIGSLTFANPYTSDQLYQLIGFTGGTSATRKQAFIDYMIAHPEDHTKVRQALNYAYIGYGLSYSVGSLATLTVLALSSTSFQRGVASSGVIIGATAGSTISASGLPSGLTINGTAHTWAWDGTGTGAATGSFTLTETLSGALHSPRATGGSYSIAAAAAATTFDPANTGAGWTLDGTKLVATASTVSGNSLVLSTAAKASGVAKFTVSTGGSGTAMLGIATTAQFTSDWLGDQNFAIGYHSNGSIYKNGSPLATVASYTAADVIEFDWSGGVLTIKKNASTVYTSSNVSADIPTAVPVAGATGSGWVITADFTGW